ncbi:MAG TPA: phosphatase PAP2 family protein [Chitinophagaceae bacterium]|nr:phosphatase PAP2 family protein [Chitinophagaceae bacterium]
MVTLNIKQFIYGTCIAAVLAAVLFGASYATGKSQLFLLLNGNLGIAADYFFGVWTNMGDALIWIAALLAVVFILKQKKAWPLLVIGFIVSTILIQVCKYVIIPDAPRPWKAIPDHSLIHHVWFVQPWLISSFPSGHTGTAFSIYLIFCLLIPKNWWLVAGLIYAMLVGYSRIYLAQHFPFDVAAGIVVGIITAFAAFLYTVLAGPGFNKH